MECRHCGRIIDNDSIFCKYCGGGLRDIKFNDTFVNTKEQNLFAQIFRFEMPLDKKLSKEYRRPIPDMKKFEQYFEALHGENDEPTLKHKVALLYGEPVAQWLDDLMPNLICYQRTMTLEEIWDACSEQSLDLM